MAILKFKDENNQWQDLPAIRGRDGVIQYQAGNGITIDNNTISAIQQDLSNYYTKSEVNNLIAAIETVSLDVEQTLPATGEPNVIYLVPSSDPGTQNAMDEYIYVNNAWEKIGSTAVDLSNYYTKSEVDTAIAACATEADLEPGGSHFMSIKTVTRDFALGSHAYGVALDSSSTLSNPAITSIQSLLRQIFDDVNKHWIYKPEDIADYDGQRVLIVGRSESGSEFIQTLFVRFNQTSPNPTYGTLVYKDDVTGTLTGNISLTYTDNKVSNVTISGNIVANGYLSKTNMNQYTPSGDYNPATKKYVDDAVAGAGGVTQADLLKRGIYVRCDTQLNNTDTASLSNAAIAELQAGLQAAYDAGLSTVDITLAFKTNNSNTLGYMSYQVYNLRLHSGIHLIGKPTSMHYSEFNSNTTTFADAAPIKKFQLVISATWSGNTITVTRAEYRLVQKTIMFLDNTYNYTPTANYHPASKKYVDDSIAAIPTPTATEQRVIYIDISSTYTSVLSGDRTYQNITIPTEALAELNALDDISNALIIIHTAYDHVLLNPQSKGTLIDSSVTPNVYGNTYVGTAIRYGSVVPSTPTYTQCCLVIKYTKDPFTLTGTCDFRSRPQEIALKSELHTHTNKTLLDTLTAGDVSDWNSAVTNSHTHTNKTVLDGISSSDITNWNKTHIYSGTSTPGAGTGENGDIYVKYTA